MDMVEAKPSALRIGIRTQSWYRFLAKFSLAFSRYAAEPEDSEEWRLKKIIGVATALVGVPTYFAYGLLYLSCHERLAGWLAMAAAFLLCSGLMSYGLARRYALHWNLWIGAHG